jgi:hypothetical protein
MIQNAEARGNLESLQGSMQTTRNSMAAGELGHLKPLLADKLEDAEVVCEEWKRIDKQLAACLENGVQKDLNDILKEAKSAKFDPDRIEIGNVALERWSTLRGAINSQEHPTIAKAIQQAKSLNVCQKVIKEAEVALRAMDDLRHWISQTECSSGLLQGAMDKVVSLGISGKIVQLARGAIRARELQEKKTGNA